MDEREETYFVRRHPLSFVCSLRMGMMEVTLSVRDVRRSGEDSGDCVLSRGALLRNYKLWVGKAREMD